ncbi:hypothetical protein [Kineococcus sp. SYSU DK003]|uniref:hypothetical protein n=1 Tax=Kineococcus sp. SYSU DK003 TaxID=3383124 RepID=UPI003D7E147C
MAARFNPAPGWPAAPDGWLPPAGWRPDPSWPAAPAGWPIVVHATTPVPPRRIHTPRGRVLQLLRARAAH